MDRQWENSVGGCVCTTLKFKYISRKHRVIPEKKTWEGKRAGDIFFYGWLVPKVFKLYGSLVSVQI